MCEQIKRCDWATKSKLEQEYHDTEWGIPLHDESRLFSLLMLEGKQAGLSWATILAKRETLYKAFDNFDPARLIQYDEAKVQALMQDSGVIKNRLKIQAVVHNAKAYLRLCEECGSLDAYLWGFVGHQPIVNAWESRQDVPASTPLSDAISGDLKRRGFKFVGSTIIYAYMQSIGMVNDHLTSCAFYHRGGE